MRVTAMLERVQSAQDEELTAIKNADEEMMTEAAGKIDCLLVEIAECLTIKREIPAEKKLELAKRFKAVREQREANRRILEETLAATGTTITRISSGKKTLNAYSNPLSKKELFLKKDC